MGQTARLEVVIGAAPTSDLHLRSELHLLKPALLYADHVTLYSPLATLLSAVAAMGSAEGTDRIEVLASIATALDAPGADQIHEALQMMESLNSLPRSIRRSVMRKEQAKKLAALTQELEGLWGGFRVKVEEILTSAGAEDLIQPMEAGLLTIDPLTETEAPDPDEIVRVFLEKLGSVLAGGRAYPLFDDQTGSLVTARIAEGLFTATTAALQREKETGSAAELMQYIPAFPLASVTDVLSIRDELRHPLVRFRSAMVTLAAVLESGPRDPGFKDDLEQVYRSEIAPALQEIEDEVRSNRYLHQLLGESARDIPKWLGAGFLALATTPITDVPALVVAGATAIGPAVQAGWKKHLAAAGIRKKQYYFLYETQHLLA